MRSRVPVRQPSSIEDSNQRAAAIAPRPYGIGILDAAVARARTAPAGGVVQRKDHDISDDALKYDDTTALLRKGFNILRKPKDLHEDPDRSSTLIGTIPARRSITVEEPPTGGTFQRSWAKVSLKLDGVKQTGYINTRDSFKRTSLKHVGAGALMRAAGPEVADIKQHSFGDCFLLAGLLSLTRNSPAYVRHGLFQTDPTDPKTTKHRLRFYRLPRVFDGTQPATAEDVTVQNTVLKFRTTVRSRDGHLSAPGTNYGATGDWSWPAIVEKAYAAWPGRSGLNSLSGGRAGLAATELSGDFHNVHSLNSKDPDGDRDALIAAVNQPGAILVAVMHKLPSDAWTRANTADGQGSTDEEMVGGIAFGHSYEIVGADSDSVTLRNPWGRYARINGVVDHDAAESVLSWEEFGAVVASWTYKQ